VNQFTVARQQVRDLIDPSSDAINHQDWAALEAMMTENVVWERADRRRTIAGRL
jgi:ketosteroid isomerase-like protein